MIKNKVEEHNEEVGNVKSKIIKISTLSKINIPNSELTITGTEDDPAALIQVYRSGEPTDIEVGLICFNKRKIPLGFNDTDLMT